MLWVILLLLLLRYPTINNADVSSKIVRRDVMRFIDIPNNEFRIRIDRTTTEILKPIDSAILSSMSISLSILSFGKRANVNANPGRNKTNMRPIIILIIFTIIPIILPIISIISMISIFILNLNS